MSQNWGTAIANCYAGYTLLLLVFDGILSWGCGGREKDTCSIVKRDTGPSPNNFGK